LRLKRVQRRGVPQRQADIVEPFEQAELAEGIDLELRLNPRPSVTVCASSETVS
jgi:hypothetical protein